MRAFGAQNLQIPERSTFWAPFGGGSEISGLGTQNLQIPEPRTFWAAIGGDSGNQSFWTQNLQIPEPRTLSGSANFGSCMFNFLSL